MQSLHPDPLSFHSLGVLKRSTVDTSFQTLKRNILPHICVVIPMYNAQDHIKQVITTLPYFIQKIVVVDDCSTDSSYEQVKSLADPRVHLVRHSVNQGVGGATLSGYQKAAELEAEIIVKMDADGQMDPAYLLPLIAPILSGEADYVKGNRFLHSRQLQAMPPLRQIGNIGLSFLTKLASGYWNVFDPTNGYTALHAVMVSLLNEAPIARRYFYESSMLLELGLLRAVVHDVHIPARYGNESSSLSELKTLFEFPPYLLKGFIRRILVQYFLRDFSIASLFLVAGTLLCLFGLLFGTYHWYLSALSATPASTGTVMLAVLPIILGIQFLLHAITADIQNVPVNPIHPGLKLAQKIQNAIKQ